ncbi:MAG: M48 family metallopeptidase [Phycisphaerae bacterium]|nr:M48 family metallopeptidase [Phycisphaerae bacterium]
MNFFEHQEHARRRTTTLVVLFGLAVVLIVAAIYFVAMAVWNFYAVNQVQRQIAQHSADVQPTWWNLDVLLVVLAATLVIVGSASLMKISSLSAGGCQVAAWLGGRVVHPDTQNAAERRLMNVVEEMSIAAGVPVPQVFVMDFEQGINAFAAGYSPDDAAVAVTSGCLHGLTRDELQGVIAHEFSHILNGDMRLNIRLIGILYGILVIGMLGFGMVRAAAYGGGGRRGKGNPVPIIVIGLALAVIGYIGVFFGRLIKCAVSRQREFLADASAVQFTRNPGGIAGALRKIGGLTAGSRIESPAAEEASHMFFGNALRGGLFFGSLLSTHPPLEERIRRVDPTFDGEFPRFVIQPGVSAADRIETGAISFEAGAAALPAARPAAARFTLNPDHVVGYVGAPTDAHLSHGAALIADIPDTLRSAAREPFGAVALIYALLLDRDDEARQAQLAALTAHADASLVAEARRLVAATSALDARARLPLVDMAAAAMRELTKEQAEELIANVRRLIEADRRVTMFEFALRTTIQRHMGPVLGRPARRTIQFYSTTGVIPDCVVLLSALAHAGQPVVDDAARAFAAGMSRLRTSRGTPPTLLPRSACTFEAMERSLDRLAVAAPAVQKHVIDACAHCVAVDGAVTVLEAELLRAMAHTMGCPLPPFLESAAPS